MTFWWPYLFVSYSTIARYSFRACDIACSVYFDLLYVDTCRWPCDSRDHSVSCPIVLPICNAAVQNCLDDIYMGLVLYQYTSLPLTHCYDIPLPLFWRRYLRTCYIFITRDMICCMIYLFDVIRIIPYVDDILLRGVRNGIYLADYRTYWWHLLYYCIARVTFVDASAWPLFIWPTHSEHHFITFSYDANRISGVAPFIDPPWHSSRLLHCLCCWPVRCISLVVRCRWLCCIDVACCPTIHSFCRLQWYVDTDHACRWTPPLTHSFCYFWRRLIYLMPQRRIAGTALVYIWLTSARRICRLDTLWLWCSVEYYRPASPADMPCSTIAMMFNWLFQLPFACLFADPTNAFWLLAHFCWYWPVCHDTCPRWRRVFILTLLCRCCRHCYHHGLPVDRGLLLRAIARTARCCRCVADADLTRSANDAIRWYRYWCGATLFYLRYRCSSTTVMSPPAVLLTLPPFACCSEQCRTGKYRDMRTSRVTVSVPGVAVYSLWFYIRRCCIDSRETVTYRGDVPALDHCRIVR